MSVQSTRAVAGGSIFRYLCACYEHHTEPIDPVANFHYGNGAILAKVLPDADHRYRARASHG